VGAFSDKLHVVHEDVFRFREARVIELAFQYGCNACVGSSLNTQEVSMAIQSIRTAIEVRDITGNHLLVPPGKMPRRKMDGVRELDYLAEKVRPRPKALDDPRNLLSARAGAPEIIGCGSFAGGVGILNDLYFCSLLRDRL